MLILKASALQMRMDRNNVFEDGGVQNTNRIKINDYLLHEFY